MYKWKNKQINLTNDPVIYSFGLVFSFFTSQFTEKENRNDYQNRLMILSHEIEHNPDNMYPDLLYVQTKNLISLSIL